MSISTKKNIREKEIPLFAEKEHHRSRRSVSNMFFFALKREAPNRQRGNAVSLGQTHVN